MTQKTDSSFPETITDVEFADANKEKQFGNTYSYGGLKAGEYAAIHLRVPKSGTPWLDEMIAEANWRDLIASMMQGIVENEALSYPSSMNRQERAYLNAKLYAAQPSLLP